jgi:Uma2 family endonuclease
MLTLNFPPKFKLTEEMFTELAIANRDLRLELTQQGELIIMPPTGGETGERNASIIAQLWWWNQQTKLGKVFDSSTGFKLPNDSIRSPDASWVKQERWDTLSLEQRKKFIPLCPDFLIELLSETDNLTETENKMKEYLEQGLKLGWLIIPNSKQVEIYRPNQEKETVKNTQSLAADNILPEFRLDFSLIWD